MADQILLGVVCAVLGGVLGALIAFSFVRADCDNFGRTSFASGIYTCAKEAKK